MSGTDYESRWLDAGCGCGCGWAATLQGRIMTGAPIFNKLRGWELDRCPAHLIYEKLYDKSEDSVRGLAITVTQSISGDEAVRHFWPQQHD
jgi:hypothetical protein